jgi:peptidoglycan/xylan/chitin deacetylase (PgdA/CDA1 family)
MKPAGTWSRSRRTRIPPVRVLRLLKGVAHLLLLAFGQPLAAIVERAARISSQKAGLALIYHGISEARADAARDLVRSHSASLFEQQIKHLGARYRVVPASELSAAARARRRGDRFPVAVTFDDDLGSHVTVALPILRRAGVPATFFLCGASLEAPFAFWWERLQRAFDLRPEDVRALVGGAALGVRSNSISELGAVIEAMSPEERDRVSARLAHSLGPDPEDAGIRADDVRKLVSSGMEIGFHTLRHHPLPSLDHAALARALSDGRDTLEAAAGMGLRTVAYPHGRADQRVANAARAAGFEIGFAGQRSAVGPESDPLLLGRLGPSYRSVGQFAIEVVWTLIAGSRAPSSRPPPTPGSRPVAEAVRRR